MYIGSNPSDTTSGRKPRDEFVGDGSTLNFALSQQVPGSFESNVIVVVTNVIQQPVAAYTITGTGQTLTFVSAPGIGAIIYVLHQGTASYQLIPATGSVAPETLADNLRNFTVDTFTGNGSTTSYTLSLAPASANAVLISVGGAFKTRTIDYTVSGTTLTFTSAPINLAAITIVHLGFTSTVRTSVIDGSITPVKLSASTQSAITGKSVAMSIVFGG